MAVPPALAVRLLISAQLARAAPGRFAAAVTVQLASTQLNYVP
jgi:hypothetical protein